MCEGERGAPTGSPRPAAPEMRRRGRRLAAGGRTLVVEPRPPSRQTKRPRGRGASTACAAVLGSGTAEGPLLASPVPGSAATKPRSPSRAHRNDLHLLLRRGGSSGCDGSGGPGRGWGCPPGRDRSAGVPAGGRGKRAREGGRRRRAQAQRPAAGEEGAQEDRRTSDLLTGDRPPGAREEEPSGRGGRGTAWETRPVLAADSGQWTGAWGVGTDASTPRKAVEGEEALVRLWLLKV